MFSKSQLFFFRKEAVHNRTLTSLKVSIEQTCIKFLLQLAQQSTVRQEAAFCQNSKAFRFKMLPQYISIVVYTLHACREKLEMYAPALSTSATNIWIQNYK